MLGPSVALADSPYRLDLRVDLPVLALGAAGSTLALVEVPPAACLPDCEPEGINALDRMVLGNYSETAHTIADVGVIAMLLAPPLLNAFDSGGDGWATDTVVYAEALVLTQALTQIVKFAVRRPAPLVYDPEVPAQAQRSRDASRSFFSGHTSMAFAAASAYTTTFWLRHPDSPMRWVVLGSGLVLGLAIGVLKVEAGYHFWTDIAAGALAGSAIGVLVPMLHTSD
jgi:membrane-associated phospholipid phosphatase